MLIGEVTKRVRDWSTEVPPEGGMRAVPEVRKARQDGNRSATPERKRKPAGGFFRRRLQNPGSRTAVQFCGTQRESHCRTT